MNNDALAEQHLDLLDACVAKFVQRLPLHVDADAFRGAALEALVVAGRRFDAEVGVPFAMFAWSRMWWAMKDESRHLDWHSRLERERGQTLDGEPLFGAPVSLDKPHGTLEDDGISLGDLVPARGADFVETACARIDLLDALRELPERHQKVLLASMVGLQHIELAPELGIGASRVSQIEKASRRKLVAKVV